MQLVVFGCIFKWFNVGEVVNGEMRFCTGDCEKTQSITKYYSPLHTRQHSLHILGVRSLEYKSLIKTRAHFEAFRGIDGGMVLVWTLLLPGPSQRLNM